METDTPHFINLIRNIEQAIESGEIGKAGRIFEAACQMYDAHGGNTNEHPDLIRVAAGILLLHQCEAEVRREAETQPA